MLTAVGVFAALFVLDFVWAKYTQAMTSKRALGASCYASAIILLSGFAAVSYTANPMMLIPAMAGAFAGTFTAVRFTKEGV